MENLSALPQWEHAMTRLGILMERHGDEARGQAAGYVARYQGRRAAMVFDVVASRQRRYEARVLRMVATFARTPAAASLRALAHEGPGLGHGLRTGEGATMQAVATGLVRFSADRNLDDDEGAHAWAESAAPFAHAPKLEPYVGSTNGVGPALFAYLRMRSGADALKPDLRVRRGLNHLGFGVPSDEHAILIVAHAAAAQLGISRLVLDQLLWWSISDEAQPTPHRRGG